MVVERLKSGIERSPYWVQYLSRWVYGKVRPVSNRYGPLFRSYYHLLQESQWWDQRSLKEYQLRELGKLLRHACENVPYYREVFEERGLKPDDIKDLTDLKALPYLTKEIVKERFNDLIAVNIPASELNWSSTGGSTGTPLRFFSERRRTEPIDWAFVWRAWNWAGYSFGEKCAILRECTVHRREGGRRSWWEFDPANNWLILSTYQMNQTTLTRYVDKLRAFGPKAIQAFPSALYLLAKFMESKGHGGFPTLETVICSSENLYPFQRRLIGNVLGCEVRSLYGQGEGVVVASECKKGSLHISSEYGVTELIGKDGDWVREGEIGEIVGTGFYNYAMPLIRYRTEDMAALSRTKCGCGRELPLLRSLEGRLQEFIVTRDGGLIPLRSLFCSAHLEEMNKIRKFQVVQREPGRLVLKLSVSPGFQAADAEAIRHRVEEEADRGVEMEVVLVDNIPVTEAGKHSYMVQQLPVEKIFFGALRH